MTAFKIYGKEGDNWSFLSRDGLVIASFNHNYVPATELGNFVATLMVKGDTMEADDDGNKVTARISGSQVAQP